MKNNKEINKYIHEKIMGKCWHDVVLIDRDGFLIRSHCSTCKTYVGLDNPKYTSDASPRSLLNEVVAKVAEMGGRTRHAEELFDLLLANPEIGDEKSYIENTCYFITAPAEQIARACVKVHLIAQ